jgi:hypothetical protein
MLPLIKCGGDCDGTASALVLLVKVRVSRECRPRGGQDRVCHRGDLRWELRAAGAVFGPRLPIRSGPRARLGDSDLLEHVGAAAGRGHYAGDCVVEAGGGRDGEGNASALPGPNGRSRTNLIRHADACSGGGTNRTRGDPGRMNVGRSTKQEAGIGVRGGVSDAEATAWK